MNLKIKLLKGRISYILYNVIILTIAYFLDRFLQMLMFILLFELLQNCFNYRFHSDTIIENPIKAVKWCKVITISVEITYLIFCKGLKVSVYSNLFIIFLIAFINCLLQFYLEKVIIKKNIFNNLKSLKALCNEANLTEIATNRMIMKYVEKKTYIEIAEIENVEEDTIKQSIKRSKRKIRQLNI